MTETDDPQLPQGSFATGKWVFPKRPLKDQTAGVHPKMSNPSLATAKDYGALTALGDLHRAPVSGVVHGYSRGQQDTVALCRSGPSIHWFWRSQSSPHHKQPGQQRRPRRPKLPLMVGIHYWPEHHWMSLDVIGRWWLALSRKHGQGTTSQKLPLQSLHRVPLNKKTGSRESICIWLTATHILATHLPYFTKLHPCHLGRCTKRSGVSLSQVKICSPANCDPALLFCSIKYLFWPDLWCIICHL